jgi:hypothetical protein
VWAAEQARGSREGEQQRLAPSHAAHLREQGDGSTHARVHVGQQSMHARGAAERARSMTRTGSREGMRPGAIPACTEAAIGKCDDILSWGAWTRAGAAAQARGAAERARSGVCTGGREGEQPGGQGRLRDGSGWVDRPRAGPKPDPLRRPMPPAPRPPSHLAASSGSPPPHAARPTAPLPSGRFVHTPLGAPVGPESRPQPPVGGSLSPPPRRRAERERLGSAVPTQQSSRRSAPCGRSAGHPSDLPDAIGWVP